jgi:hypothetical protein
MNEKLIESILKNIKLDRTFSSSILTTLITYLLEDPERYKMSGAVASKLIENLQRSNEQLIKLYEVLKKGDSGSELTT